MKKLKIALCVIVFIMALGLTLYPLISNILAEKYQSTAIADYTAAISDIDNSVLEKERQAAEDYNRRIAERAVIWDGPNATLYLNTQAEGYDSILNLNDDGIMGYVSIPVIDVVLPLYHGVDGATLDQGAGHLPGSSLPVGGENTHAIFAAHSGLASQRMFSDLDQLEIGNTFFLYVLGETLAYEVDQITVVEPDDASTLGNMDGGDYVTLITCTPYGVNSHRLLVRGKHVPYTPTEETDPIEDHIAPAPSTWREQYIKGIVLGITILAGLSLLVMAVWYVYCRKHRRRKRYKHEKRW